MNISIKQYFTTFAKFKGFQKILQPNPGSMRLSIPNPKRKHCRFEGLPPLQEDSQRIRGCQQSYVHNQLRRESQRSLSQSQLSFGGLG